MLTEVEDDILINHSFINQIIFLHMSRIRHNLIL